MSFTIRLLIWFKGRQVGSDSYGNRYYEERPGRNCKEHKPRRWVIYKGNHEASKVPPEWHAWLHYRSDQPLEQGAYEWQKPHKPNLTGTPLAYHPEAADKDKVVKLSTKKKRTYEPWTPNG